MRNSDKIEKSKKETVNPKSTVTTACYTSNIFYLHFHLPNILSNTFFLNFTIIRMKK